MAILSGDEMIRVHNFGGEDYNGRWNSKRYVVRTGKDGFIPFSLAKKDFGDPRSQTQKIRLQIDQNVVEYVPSRIDELHRLALNYGIHQNPDDYAQIKSRMPRVALYTIDGEEIPFIVDDPECQIMMGNVDDTDRESLLEELQMMRRRMMMLEAHLASQLPDDEAAAVTTDEPPQETAHHIVTPDPAFGTEPGDLSGWDFGEASSDQQDIGGIDSITEDTPNRPTLPRRRPTMPRPRAVVS